MSVAGADLLSEISSAQWRQALSERLPAAQLAKLSAAIKSARAGDTPVFPPEAQQFAAFNHHGPADIRVIILGQDPYHGAGQANGLSFSVNEGVRHPPSLRNILKEVCEDIGQTKAETGDLNVWATQGVFLLNAVLSVAEGQAGSHRTLGWQALTREAIGIVSDMSEASVFMLWGKDAQKHEEAIDASRHAILKSVHPSPLSAYRGFFGSRHFSKANEFLVSRGRPPIDW